MVTHETYRRRNGDWVDPSSVALRNEGANRQAFDESTGESLIIGDFEKMSKSKLQCRRPGRHRRRLRHRRRPPLRSVRLAA